MTNTRQATHGPTRSVVKPVRTAQSEAINGLRLDQAPIVSTASEESPTQAATRMLREIARDIRGPLSGAKESIRMVRDAAVGSINDQQRSLLSGALDQFEVIDFVTAELQRSDLQTSSAAITTRRWVTIGSLIESVSQATSAIQNVRRIGLRIDNMVDTPTEVFVDPAAIVRLVTNLVFCATRVSNAGQNVCLRLESQQHGSEIRWMVIDQGPGISQDRLRKLTQRGTSMSGSAGLGWTIARRLASSAHSTLTIESKLGRGTSVSFTSPAGSAAAVASSYARWRLANRTSGTKPRRRSNSISGQSRQLPGDPNSGNRIPSMDAGEMKNTIQLGPEWRRPKSDAQVMVGTLTVGALVPRQSVEDLQVALQQCASEFDLFYQVEPSRYIYCIDATPRRISERIEQINADINRHLLDMRMRWSEPAPMAIDRHDWVNKLSDLMVRQTLCGVASPNVIDRDDIRPGTETLKDSAAVNSRLDAEIRHLGKRLDGQTGIMRAHAAKLRRQN